MNQIKIYITKDMIEIEGHAKADVCASISSVMYTAVNIMLQIDNESVEYKDTGTLVIIKRLKHSNELDASWDTMIRMFKDAADMADGDIIIEYEEINSLEVKDENISS